MSKSLYAKALMSPGWKRAAKINRKRFGVTVRDFLDAMKLLHKAEALAASRLELLEEVRQLLDDIYAEDIVSSGDLGKVYEKVAEELGDG